MSEMANETGQRELAKAYEPAAIEEKWAKYWVDENVFTVDPEAEGEAFTMLLPPPNVTGRLHMGHMLNQTEMDILTRWHRMRGERAVWVPGTDHAGIATQMMVERQLAAEGVKREELGRDNFLERVWGWKKQYGGAITDQMRRLGASVDWEREYFTMEEGLSRAVTEAFVRLWEQGLIYRGAYIVNWDPVAGTAVSDLEVESEERVGKLYQIRYPLADGSGSVVVATTRPETMLGDTAVAVNPADERYTAVVGKMLRLPLTGREIPVVADDWANPEFGTGAVKVTPAHDPNDFGIGQRCGLPSISVLDKAARVDLPLEATGNNAEGAAARAAYQGLDRFEARKRIVADLEAAGLLVLVKEHAMTVPVSQRTGSVIEPRLSEQWFLKIAPLAEKATAAVREGHIRFTPEMYAKTYFEWMGNIHDWCLSRQLWWGHRIPAWFCDECGTVSVARTAPEACGCGGALRQETDVLDTWFSSGLLPFTVFGWPEPRSEMARKYPTSLLVTGFDILFFWVARMIMLGCHFMLDVPMADGSARTLADAVPFREVYIHALVRDAERQKMSKTKGNVIDPIEVIERFGTDAVRFTLASMASPGTDIAFSEERTEGNRAFANKIWNAARFLFMHLEKAGKGVVFDGQVVVIRTVNALEARWIQTRLSETAERVGAALEEYRFDEAANAVYGFFWGEFCDWYLELVKLRLKFTEGEENEAALAALGTFVEVFEAALRLLSPFMPFITEEIWQALRGGSAPERSIALTRFPLAEDFARDAGAVAEMEVLQGLIVNVRGLRKELGVPEKEAAAIRVWGEPAAAIALDHAGVLAKMARVSAVERGVGAAQGDGMRSVVGFDVQVVYERVVDVAAERERLSKDAARYEKGLTAAERQLGNEGFMAKAPAHIVEGLRRQAEETRGLLEKARAGLAELERMSEKR